jgi:hypothetical protein
VKTDEAIDGGSMRVLLSGGFISASGAEFLRSDVVPAFERAVEFGRLRVSQQVDNFTDGDS